MDVAFLCLFDLGQQFFLFNAFFCLEGIEFLLIFNEIAHIIEGEPQRVFFIFCRRNDPNFVSRVKKLEFIFGNTEEFRYLVERKDIVYDDGVDLLMENPRMNGI